MLTPRHTLRNRNVLTTENFIILKNRNWGFSDFGMSILEKFTRSKGNLCSSRRLKTALPHLFLSAPHAAQDGRSRRLPVLGGLDYPKGGKRLYRPSALEPRSLYSRPITRRLKTLILASLRPWLVS